MSAVVCEELCKSFQLGRTAACVSFRIERGEAFGLLGPNGAGKTTTMSMLATLLRPSGGRATVARFDLLREAASVRRAIGVAMQEASLSPHSTGREHLHMMGRLHGLDWIACRRRSEELIEALDLTAIADRWVGRCSGGERRRIDLACALMHRPRILFLDEPTLGLDPSARAALWCELSGMQRRGMTMFLTTHYLEEADRLCDRIAILSEGRIVAEGPPARLKAELGADAVRVTVAPSDLEAASVALRPFGPARVDRSGGTVAVRAVDGEAAAVAVLETLMQTGIAASSVRVERPTLEDVLARHTRTA